MTKLKAASPLWPWVEAATFVLGPGPGPRAAIMQGAVSGVKPEGEGAGKKGDIFLFTEDLKQQ